MVGLAVANGLNPQAQQARDSVRVIGNAAVHPEQLVLDEANSLDIFRSLCSLLNLVVGAVGGCATRMAQEMFDALLQS